jgi:hypothetical protein
MDGGQRGFGSAVEAGLVDWSIGRLVDWSIGRLADWPIG